MLPAAPEQASPSRPERAARTGPEGRRRRRAPSGLFEPVQLVRSFPEALRKLHPRTLVRNPVLFVVSVGAVLTTLSALLHPAVFTWVISLWLWLTVVFANLAEAVAEGRGKAQAESLRRARNGHGGAAAHALELRHRSTHRPHGGRRRHRTEAAGRGGGRGGRDDPGRR
jgi:K+-transporting ATPase ATPase B chain